MRYLYLLSLICLLMMGGVSCTQKNHDYKVSGDYLLIGHVGGFVFLPSYPFYIISNGQFREDPAVQTGNQFPSDISQFHFNTLLPDSKYQQVKYLQTSIPSELLGRNNQTIGNIVPDMGGTVVWAYVNGVTYKWDFEGDQSSSSQPVQDFVTSLAIVFQ